MAGPPLYALCGITEFLFALSGHGRGENGREREREETRGAAPGVVAWAEAHVRKRRPRL